MPSSSLHPSDFLLYTAPDGEVKVDVFIKDETVWLTQKRMAELFGVDRSVVTKHLQNIFESGELKENSVCAKFAHTAGDGKTYETAYKQFRVSQDRAVESDFDRKRRV